MVTGHDMAVELSETHWRIVEPYFPALPRREDGRGRPGTPVRPILEGVLWILRTGAPWRDLPERFPPRSTCHRRFQAWVRTGVLARVLETLYEVLSEQEQLDLRECFIDATFVSAKKGGLDVGKTKRGKGTKIMAITDASGLPIALHLASASPHEVTLVHDTLDATFGFDHPKRLIGDRAYDSDGLDAELAPLGIEMIAPNRRNRRKTQDGRPLRRYRRRWKVERFFAWLHNFRRLVVRWEWHAENFLGMVHLAVVMILLRAVSR